MREAGRKSCLVLGCFVLPHLSNTLHRRRRQNGVTWLQRDLVLEKLSPRLENTNFSCVLVDPAQVTQRHVLLAQLWVRMMGVPRWTKRWGRGGTLSTWGRMLSKGVCRGVCVCGCVHVRVHADPEANRITSYQS